MKFSASVIAFLGLSAVSSLRAIVSSRNHDGTSDNGKGANCVTKKPCEPGKQPSELSTTRSLSSYSYRDACLTTSKDFITTSCRRIGIHRVVPWPCPAVFVFIRCINLCSTSGFLTGIFGSTWVDFFDFSFPSFLDCRLPRVPLCRMHA